ncbi:MAG: helix-turn-helix domain-containing protein [Hyphomicrobiaceae bacterium]|nr:helix-turn-helix domain-containing protein [Hyphomicrobiaceae bacterium]
MDAILEAAARILRRAGLAGLTTNRIAAEAGVSIGTLYQFFRSKEAILVTIARRQLEADRRAMRAALLPVLKDPAAPIERIAVRAVIATYAGHERVRQLVMQTMIGLGLQDEVTGPARDVAALLQARVEAIAAPYRVEATPARILILTSAVEAAVRAAAYARMPYFGTPAFEDDLVRLVLGFLNGPAEGRG